MRIDEFNVGDVVQRTAPARTHYGTDYSYMGDPMRLEWLEGDIIFLLPLKYVGTMRKVVDLPQSLWGNDWDFYPVETGRRLGIIREDAEVRK